MNRIVRDTFFKAAALLTAAAVLLSGCRGQHPETGEEALLNQASPAAVDTTYDEVEEFLESEDFKNRFPAFRFQIDSELVATDELKLMYYFKANSNCVDLNAIEEIRAAAEKADIAYWILSGNRSVIRIACDGLYSSERGRLSITGSGTDVYDTFSQRSDATLEELSAFLEKQGQGLGGKESIEEIIRDTYRYVAAAANDERMSAPECGFFLYTFYDVIRGADPVTVKDAQRETELVCLPPYDFHEDEMLAYFAYLVDGAPFELAVNKLDWSCKAQPLFEEHFSDTPPAEGSGSSPAEGSGSSPAGGAASPSPREIGTFVPVP